MFLSYMMYERVLRAAPTSLNLYTFFIQITDRVWTVRYLSIHTVPNPGSRYTLSSSGRLHNQV